MPSRTARRDLARRLLDEGRFSLAEVAARVGVHPTTLFRWRKGEKV
jgi:transposase-like protein